MFFPLLALSSPGQEIGSNINLLNSRTLWPSARFGQIVLWTRRKSRRCPFGYAPFPFPWNWRKLFFIWTNLNSLYPRMQDVWAKLGLKSYQNSYVGTWIRGRLGVRSNDFSPFLDCINLGPAPPTKLTISSCSNLDMSRLHPTTMMLFNTK